MTQIPQQPTKNAKRLACLVVLLLSLVSLLSVIHVTYAAPFVVHNQSLGVPSTPLAAATPPPLVVDFEWGGYHFPG
jgi:hypothetical protein